MISVSIVQFSFTLAAKREKIGKKESLSCKILDLVFGTEIWSLFLIFFIQDFPFFILRCIIMKNYTLSRNYMIYFLVTKNFVLLIVELYRIYAIYLVEVHEKSEKGDEEKKNEIHAGNCENCYRYRNNNLKIRKYDEIFRNRDIV